MAGEMCLAPPTFDYTVHRDTQQQTNKQPARRERDRERDNKWTAGRDGSIVLLVARQRLTWQRRPSKRKCVPGRVHCLLCAVIIISLFVVSWLARRSRLGPIRPPPFSCFFSGALPHLFRSSRSSLPSSSSSLTPLPPIPILIFILVLVFASPHALLRLTPLLINNHRFTLSAGTLYFVAMKGAVLLTAAAGLLGSAVAQGHRRHGHDVFHRREAPAQTCGCTTKVITEYGPATSKYSALSVLHGTECLIA